MAENTGQGAGQAMVMEGEPGARPSEVDAVAGRRPRPARTTRVDPAKAARRSAAPESTMEPASVLRRQLREFASTRPQGWDHNDWIRFLESLKDGGYDIRDRDAIGVALEKERLDLALSSVRGLGPQRRRALVERFGTVWTMRNADPAEIARVAKVPLELAESARGATAT